MKASKKKLEYISRYKKENTKQKIVVFYKKDKDIYEYACKINFGEWVKDKLRDEIRKRPIQDDM